MNPFDQSLDAKFRGRKVRAISNHDAIYEGYEVIEGHKRLWVCQCAGLESHPVEVIECSDWKATRAFVTDYLPTESHVEEDGSTHRDWYDSSESEAAIQLLVEAWGDRAVK
jgi:ParB-like chromosome segregation protein Spo0J